MLSAHVRDAADCSYSKDERLLFFSPFLGWVMVTGAIKYGAERFVPSFLARRECRDAEPTCEPERRNVTALRAA